MIYSCPAENYATTPAIGPFCPHDLVTSGSVGKIRHLLTVCLTTVHMID